MLFLCFCFPFALGSLFSAQTAFVDVDCSNITNLDFSDTLVFYRCLDDLSLIIHSDMMDRVVPDKVEDMEWMQFEQGQLLKKKKSNKPMSSCLSTIRGGAASKSVTLTNGETGILAGDVLTTLFDVGFLRAAFLPSFFVVGRAETQAEYKCDAVVGEVLQILSTTTTYELMGWKYRPIWGAVHDEEFGEWEDILNGTIVGEFHEVSCASFPVDLKQGSDQIIEP